MGIHLLGKGEKEGLTVSLYDEQFGMPLMERNQVQRPEALIENTLFAIPLSIKGASLQAFLLTTAVALSSQAERCSL